MSERGSTADEQLAKAGPALRVLKFELQLYKLRDGEYCLDVQVRPLVSLFWLAQTWCKAACSEHACCQGPVHELAGKFAPCWTGCAQDCAYLSRKC